MHLRSYPTAFSRAARGFTLIEILVVIGIIVLLIGIAVPALNLAYRHGVRTRTAADLQAIGVGLEAYRADFKDYPRIDYPNPNLGGLQQPYGATLLAWALLSPGPATQDGADGLGFRVRPTVDASGNYQGQVYGPYLAASRFKISGTDDTNSQILDRYRHPYLYFPAFRTADPRTAYVSDWSGVGVRPMFNHADNASPTSPALSLKDMQKFLGDIDNSGTINGTEQAAFVGPYILWGAGPEQYGYDINGVTDDVVQFGL